MKHRHLVDDCFLNIAAIEDILERGKVEDWKELYERIKKNPEGEEANAVKIIVEKKYMYGTNIIWKRLLERSIINCVMQ